MIDTHQSRRLAERGLWSGHVQKLFQTLEIDGRAAAPDITESLAVFCQHHAHMTEHSLSLLMARSFCVTGDDEAAGRILRHDRIHRSHADSWIEVLSAGYPFPELYPLFSARALRPQSLTSAGALWVFDFDQIRLTDADRWFNENPAALGAMADRLRVEDPARPVLVMAKEANWMDLGAEEKARWEEVARSPAAVVARRR